MELDKKSIERIISTELSYISCFSSKEKLSNGIRFFDVKIPDMYSHNLTYIYANDKRVMRGFVMEELEYAKHIGKKFLNIQCHHNKNVEEVFPDLSYEWDSLLSYYVFDNSHLKKLMTRNDCNIKVVTDQILDEARMFDIEANGEELGIDFVERRFDRRCQVYIADNEIEHYLCYIDNEVVGQVDLFIDDEVAKIEDFDVSSKWQRQGVGTTMLKMLIDIALSKGARLIYLITDAEETAKEMYKKSGMYHIGDKYEVLFKF